MHNPGSVLFVTHEASRTGAPIMLLHFLRWLKADGRIPFAVLVRRSGPLLPEFEALGPTFVVWDMEAEKISPGLVGRLAPQVLRALRFRRLLRWARRLNVRLVYSNTAANADLDWIFDVLDRPILTHVHELEYVLDFIDNQGQIRRLLDRSIGLIAASQAVADALIRRGLLERLITVHHEFIPTTLQQADRAAVREELGVPHSAPLILGAGSLDWRKGEDQFIRLAAEIVANDEDTHFLWVGGDRFGISRFNHDAARLGLVDRVRCIGQVADPSKYFQAADVFALTSREDPYPLVMLEAAAAGLPIVCFAGGGGAPELVESDAGTAVPYLNINAMSKAIRQLLADPAERVRQGSRAAEKVRERHDIQVAAPKLAAEILRHLELT